MHDVHRFMFQVIHLGFLREMVVGIAYDPRMCAHEEPLKHPHPEQPSRITSIWAALENSGILQRCQRVQAREANDEELSSVHTKDHIKTMRRVSNKTFGKGARAALAASYNSIYFNEGSSKSALLAAGSVIELSLRVARGEISCGAAIVRPPGHHAEADKAMGFCLFNNVAIAAHILAHGKMDGGSPQKVLVVDWDVHHGNGIQHMFWEDPNVLYFSVHRYDRGYFYPGGPEANYDHVGGGPGAGFNVNVPWPHSGFGDGDYMAVWEHVLMPVAHEFSPDIVLISGGFDSAEGDPLGCCCLSPNGYSFMTRKLMELAGGKLVLVLEGGYNLSSISASYVACVQTLLGDLEVDPEAMNRESFDSTWDVIDAVRTELSRYWPVLSTKVDKPPGTKRFSTSKEVIFIDSSDDEDALDEVEDVSAAKLADDGEEVLSLLEQLNILAESAAAVQPEVEPPVQTMVTTETSVLEVVPEVTMKSTYVWYASFGSNMYRARLMCYIAGGKVDGKLFVAKGLRDKTPPLEDFWFSAPHRLFFGRTYSESWGPGGVAFLDPLPVDDNSNNDLNSSYLRAYKITLEQFNGILAGENRLDPRNFISMGDVETMKTRSPPCLDVVKGGWYGTVLYLGEKEGHPILTITCPVEDVEKNKSGELPFLPPADTYRATIVNGLVDKGLDEASANEYVTLRC